MNVRIIYRIGVKIVVYHVNTVKQIDKDEFCKSLLPF